MTPGTTDRSAELATIVADRGTQADDSVLMRTRLERFAAATPPDALAALADAYRNEPDVIAPLYERIVESEPENAQALVVLANAYWLQGRGPETVGELASKAIAIEPANRGAWHLWALSEMDPRLRTGRWEQVAERFPNDSVALAALADNAAAVAGAQRDYEMLDLAIATYDRLLERATQPAERDAVADALRALRGWRL